MDFEVPWVEKYRPQTLQDVVGNERVVTQLRAIASQGNVPNVILVGPPGCGKTTSIMCLARELLGPECIRQAVCELNASDDRGIEVVRERIKSFAQQKVTLPETKHKIIILDEADSMTSSAQQALRMIMSDYSHSTRFALACNDSSKIIEPIQSRCAIMRFTRLSDADVSRRLSQVIALEGVNCDSRGLEALTFTAEGDMRQGLNNLQATVAGFVDVTFEHVFEVCDQPHPEILRDALKSCLEGQLTAAAESLNTLWVQGFSPVDVIGSLYRVVANQELPEHIHLLYLKELAVLRMRLLEGVATILQVDGCLSKLCSIAMSS